MTDTYTPDVVEWDGYKDADFQIEFNLYQAGVLLNWDETPFTNLKGAFRLLEGSAAISELNLSQVSSPVKGFYPVLPDDIAADGGNSIVTILKADINTVLGSAQKVELVGNFVGTDPAGFVRRILTVKRFTIHSAVPVA